MLDDVKIAKTNMFMLCSSTLQEQDSEGFSYGA